MFFVFREPGGGRSTPGGALRHVPSEPRVKLALVAALGTLAAFAGLRQLRRT